MQDAARAYYQEKLKRFSDKERREFKRVPVPSLEAIKRVHLIGVCGTAMGSLAGLLAEAGFSISGSDEACYPPMSDMIKKLGITFKEGYKVEHLKGADLIVVGNTCRPDNVEAQYARENGLAVLSLPEALHLFFVEGRRSLVVAGTHGKTTTTGLLAHVFTEAKLEPTYLVGGIMKNYSHSFSVGSGPHFIVEGDEYDTAYFDKSPKFLHYAPTSAIVTSVEFDHIDIYDDMEDYRQAFRFLLEEIPDEGSVFVWGDSEETRQLGENAKADVIFYGLNSRNDIHALDVTLTPEGQEFALIVKGENLGRFFVTLHGSHNLLNTLAVCGMALEEGVSLSKLRQGLQTFEGMMRRQEIVGGAGGVTVIDDFAHHPTAVRETLKAIRDKFPDRRIVAFFEPRSNTSRRKIFEEEYGKSFDLADEVYLSIPPFRHNDKKEDFLDADKVTATISSRGPRASFYPNADTLLRAALPHLQEGDVVLIMSNGSFDGIHQKLLSDLSSQS